MFKNNSSSFKPLKNKLLFLKTILFSFGSVLNNSSKKNRSFFLILKSVLIKNKSLILTLLKVKKLPMSMNTFKFLTTPISFLSLKIEEFFETKCGFGSKAYLIFSLKITSILYFLKI